jgi:hypothetical protein
MKNTILTFSLVLLPALYLFAFIMGVRWVVHHTEGLLLKAVRILVMCALLVVVSFVSWVIIYYA